MARAPQGPVDPDYDVRIVIDAFEVTDAKDPWWLGPGEIGFRIEVDPGTAAASPTTARLPSTGTYRMHEGKQSVCREVYDGALPADAELTLRCTGFEEDLLEDDEFVRYERQFTGDPEEWAGEYGPDDEPDDPEAMADWRLWYRVEVEPVGSRYDRMEEGEKFRRRTEFLEELVGDVHGDIPEDYWRTAVEATRAATPPRPIEDDPGGPAPEGGAVEVVDGDVGAERTADPVDEPSLSAVDLHVAVEGAEDLRGTLRIGLEPETVSHVTPSTLRLFRFDEEREDWQLVRRSGLGNTGDYLWAKVSRPGTYGVFGLPRDRASRATIEMMAAARQAEPMRALAGLPSGKPEICKYILCENPTLTEGVLSEPARLEREGLGDYVDDPTLIYGRDMTDFPTDEKGKPMGPPDWYTPIGKGDEFGYEGMPGIRPGAGNVCQQCLGGGGGGVGDGGLGGPGIDIHDDIEIGDGVGGDGVITPQPSSCERWESAGPTNHAGRMPALAHHPTDGDVVYAGGASGGVWKSKDGGSSWRATMLGELSLVVGAIGVAPSDPQVVYAATGEYMPWWTGAAANFRGEGVYRSDDGGADWDLMSRDGFDNDRCSSVVVDPQNPDRVYVGGWQGVHRWNGNRERWEEILDEDVSDLAMHPNDRTELLAGLGSGTDAVMRTTNATASAGTVNWSTYDSGMDVPQNTDNLTKLAYARSDPSVIYASVNDETRASGGGWNNAGATVYRWDGSTWTDAGSPIGGTYGFWCNTIAVNPDDADNVLAGGVSMYETTDGGSTWNGRGQGHVDQQDATFDPTDGSEAVIANDGGVWTRDTDTGTRDFSSGNRKLTTIQFYNVSVSQTSSFRIGGSTQDQGVLTSDNGRTYYGLPGNEGGLFEIDPNDADTIYFNPWSRDLQKTDDGKGSGTRGATNGITGGSVSALAVKPGNSDELVCTNVENGNNRIYYSDDGASNSGTGWQTALSDARGGVKGFEYAPSDPSVVYAVTNDGRVWRSTDSGQNWTERSANGLGTDTLAGLAVDHSDASRLYVSVGGGGAGGERVWRSTDAGDTFVDVSGVEPHTRLPDLSCHEIVQDPDDRETLYVATPTGVFVTRDGGDWWYSFDHDSLPNALLSDMAYSEPKDALYVSTYGYGMWKREL